MDSTLFADKSCSIQRKIIFNNVLCYSEVNDLFTGSHHSHFEPLGHGFLVCWACKRGKKGVLSHWMNAGWIWTRMSGDFTLSQHCSLLYYFISHGKEKNILFSLAIQSNSFPANPLTPTLPSPPPPPHPHFLCHFCVILTPEPAISFGNMAEWLSGPIMPLCLEILFA